MIPRPQADEETRNVPTRKKQKRRRVKPSPSRLPFMRRVPKGAKVTSWEIDYTPMPPQGERCIDSDEGESRRGKRRTLKEPNAET